MKVAVLTVLLFVAYFKSQIAVPAEAASSDLALPIKPLGYPACALLQTSVLITKGSCSGNVPVGYCSGCCDSSVSYAPDSLLKVTRRCLCCTETKMAVKSAKLPCKPKGFYFYKYYTISGCNCTECGALSFDVSALPPVETAAVSEPDIKA